MFQGRSLALVLALFLGSLGASFLLFHPMVREASFGFIFSGDREVLSLIKTNFYQGHYKIVKVRAAKNLFLEIYEWKGREGIFDLVDRVRLTDSKDAFYKIDDKKTNLFLKDMDNDSFPEIITPSYDKNMIAHLNVFSYDVDNKKLIKLSDH